MSLKKLLPHIGVVVLFFVATMIYFSPKIEGKQLRQGDTEKYLGMSQELREYNEKGGESLWTGAMFSGMPAYLISVQGGAPNFLTFLEKPIMVLGFTDAAPLFLSLLTMYILMLVLGANPFVAVLAAFGFAFSSYSIIILEAGHVTKAWAMAYMPLVVGGLLLVARNKLYWGSLLFALGLALQIKSNHLQITYYLALFCVPLYLAFFVQQLKNKEYAYLGKATGLLTIALVLAVGANIARLSANYEMGQESIRGKSELTTEVDGKTDKSSGLDQEYAFAWSYGRMETFTVLIPNLYGGASGGTVGANSELVKTIRSQGYQASAPMQTYTYWGDQPFTSGPVYFGAVIIFLAILSLFVLKGSLKWWIAGTSLFFVFLSWGKNFEVLNNFLFHYLPMYNKFRTPSMALVMPQLAATLLAGLALVEISKGEMPTQVLRKKLIYAFSIVGGICLLFWLIPSVAGSFESVNDSAIGVPDWYLVALQSDRKALLQADALRSLIFVILSAGALYVLTLKKFENKGNLIMILLAVIALVDLWNVDRRYLNESNFVSKSKANTFVPTVANKFILQDKAPDYRVLSLNNPFNDTHVSYFHKSIGGYHAAKLRRYQDLIDIQLVPEMQRIVNGFNTAKSHEDIYMLFQQTPVLNMLNMKYLIYADQQQPIQNPYAMGAGWFVSNIEMVSNADDEIRRLGELDLRHVAVVDQRYGQVISPTDCTADTTATVVMTQYTPNEVSYLVSSEKGGAVVFSEVYYEKGWKAFVDEKQVPIFRANWILRGIKVPAGPHHVVMRFEPDHFIHLTWVVSAVSAVLVLLLIGGIVLKVKNSKRSVENK